MLHLNIEIRLERRSTVSTGQSGCFFLDKLAEGLQLNLDTGSVKSNETKMHSSFSFGIFPFVRYYVLPSTNKLNVFSGGSYGLGRVNSKYHAPNETSKADACWYFFSLRLVYFVIPKVAIELTEGYYHSTSHYKGEAKYKEGSFQTSIGFQIHLGKSKK